MQFMHPGKIFFRYWVRVVWLAVAETFSESRAAVAALGGAVIAPLIALLKEVSTAASVREMIIIALLGGVGESSLNF